MGYTYTQTDPTDKKIIVISPRDIFARRLNLSSTSWYTSGKTLSVGMLMRITSLPGTSDSGPVQEVLPATNNNVFMMGLKTVNDYANPSQDAVPLDGGNTQFFGVSTNPDASRGIEQGEYGMYTRLGTLIVGKSGAYQFKSEVTRSFGSSATNIASSAAVVSYLGMRMHIHDGHPDVRIVLGDPITGINQSNAKDTLVQYLEMGSPTVYVGDGFGWGGEDPYSTITTEVLTTDPSYFNFFIRWPFFNNVLKIYSYGWSID